MFYPPLFFPAAFLSYVIAYKLTQCPEVVFRGCKMPRYSVWMILH